MILNLFLRRVCYLKGEVDMKKIVGIVFLLFLTCGCQANYSLNIDEVEKLVYNERLDVMSNTYNEVEYFYESDWPLNAYDDEVYSSESNEKIPGVSYYQIEKNNTSPYHISYSFQFPSNRFSHSNGIRVGFPQFKIFQSDDSKTVTLDTGLFQLEKFPYLEELNVDVQVNKKVVSHNADEVMDNHYIWHLTKDDLKTKTFQLTYLLQEDTEDWINNHQALIILAAFGLFAVILAILIIIKNHKK